MSRKTKKIEKKKSNLREGGEWEDAAILIASHSHWKTLREMLSQSNALELYLKNEIIEMNQWSFFLLSFLFVSSHHFHHYQLF